MLAVYLDTGEPTSDDPTYGDERQIVLGLNGQQRSLFIRQQADALIQSCDQQQAAAEAQAQAQQQAQAQAQQQAQAEAAAQARANQELQDAQPACRAVGGSASWDSSYSVLECGNIPYLGSDGSTYYSAAGMDPGSGALEGPIETAGAGATQQECTSGYYPDLSTGPGYGPKGTWNSTLQACLPA